MFHGSSEYTDRSHRGSLSLIRDISLSIALMTVKNKNSPTANFNKLLLIYFCDLVLIYICYKLARLVFRNNSHHVFTGYEERSRNPPMAR